MAHRVPIETLREREHLTVGEACRVFGRGRDFWADVFDSGQVDGYRLPGPKGRRFLVAGHVDSWTGDVTPNSIRTFLRGDPRVEPGASKATTQGSTESMNRYQTSLNTKTARACAQDIAAYCREEDATHEDVAEVLSMNSRTLSGYLNGHSPVPVVLPILISKKLGKEMALRVVAELGQGEFTSQATPTGVTNATVITDIGRVSQEFGEAVERLTAGIADGHLDEEEAEESLARIRELQAAVGDLTRDVVAVAESNERPTFARRASLLETEPEFAASAKGAA